jgi:hypothetical protein
MTYYSSNKTLKDKASNMGYVSRALPRHAALPSPVRHITSIVSVFLYELIRTYKRIRKYNPSYPMKLSHLLLKLTGESVPLTAQAAQTSS